MSDTRGQRWPVLSFLALLGLSLLGLLSQWGQQAGVQQDVAVLSAAISPLLAQSQSRGYQQLLQLHRPVATLAIQLRDREGRVLAVWPEPLSQTRWNLLSGWLSSTHASLLDLLGDQQQVEVQAQGERVGELVIVRLPGLLGFSLQAWLFALAALWAASGIYALWRWPRPAVAESAPVTPRRLERMGSQLGPALGHVQWGLILLDRQQRVRYMNAKAAVWSGWSAGEANNLPVRSVLRSATDQLAELLQPGEREMPSREGEICLQSRDGQQRPVHLSQLTIFRRTGQPASQLILLRDLSEQQALEKSLSRRAELADSSLDVLDQALLSSDRYGRIIWLNQRAKRLFDYADDEYAGMALSKLMPVPFLKDPQVSLTQYSSRSDASTAPPAVVGWRKDATTFPLDLIAHDLGDAESWLLQLDDRQQRSALQNQAHRLESLWAGSGEWLFSFDAQSYYLNDANLSAMQGLGYAIEPLRRMTLFHLLPELDRPSLEQELLAMRTDGELRHYRDCRLVALNADVIAVDIRLFYSAKEEPPVFLLMVGPARI